MQKQLFLKGLRDALPIGLGYLTVSFSIGIVCQTAGFNILDGFLISLLNNASAGEYAGITVIAEDAGFLAIVGMMLVANARYLLMGCALSQRLAPGLPLRHRLIIGFDLTDELFGLAIARPGYVEPAYYYGAMCSSIPFWCAGTVLGIVFGTLMPSWLISGFSVMLFGMFLAVIIPAGKKDKIVLVCIAVSFVCSYCFNKLSFFDAIPSGFKTILLTVIISAGAALLFPRKEENEEK